MKWILIWITIFLLHPVSAAPIPGDIDGDGVVAFSDFLILSQNFGETGDPVTKTTTTGFSERRDLPDAFLGWWGLETANDWLDGFGDADLVGVFPSGCMFVTPSHIYYDVKLGFWEGHFWETVPYTYDSDTDRIMLEVNGKIEAWGISLIVERNESAELAFTKVRKRGGRVVRKVTIGWDWEHRRPDFWSRNISEAYTKPSVDGFILAPQESGN